MNRIARSARFIPVVLVCLAIAPALRAQSTRPAAPATQATQWIRLVETPQESHLETSIITYTNPAGVKVALISAVHIGEKTYYEELNKTFTGYDSVLYELVKPKDAPVPQPGTPASSTFGQVQRLMTDVLDLEFQLDGIDYSPKNFVHADLDAETFARLQEERGESMFTLMLQQIMHAMRNPKAMDTAMADPDEMSRELVKLITGPDTERRLKLLLARQMQDIEAAASGLSGPKGSVILTERNNAAWKVLQDTIKSGKKNIAIFYGAAHMPDLAEKLKADGFAPVKTEYRKAWELTIRPDAPSAIDKLMKEAIRLIEESQR